MNAPTPAEERELLAHLQDAIRALQKARKIAVRMEGFDPEVFRVEELLDTAKEVAGDFSVLALSSDDDK
jgi:hypothetical protein